MKKKLLYLFIALSAINLYAEYAQLESLIFASKPLLMGVLAYWYYQQERPLQTTFQRFLLTGIIFSLGGDTLLMLVENGPKLEVFFLLGLGSFLLAQLSYGWAFLNYSADQPGLVARQPWWALPFLFYLAVMLVVLWPGLNVDLKIPVTVYATAIVAMCIAAYNLKGVAPTLPWRRLMAGVLLFVLSDSLIALNKFIAPIAYARLWIMLTYLTGQLLIVYAAWELEKEEGE
jgi:uncharacterized membrane protein YhhN